MLTLKMGSQKQSMTLVVDTASSWMWSGLISALGVRTVAMATFRIIQNLIRFPSQLTITPILPSTLTGLLSGKSGELGLKIKSHFLELENNRSVRQ